MSKFKVGDKIECVCADGWCGYFEIGDTHEVIEILDGEYLLSEGKAFNECHESDFKLVEDRTNWHPHADVIIAWAKGEKIRGRTHKAGIWEECTAKSNPHICFPPKWEFQIVDDNEEIDRIKQEIQTHGKAIDEMKAKLKELES